ncbi:MAG: hypothetical protein JNL58_00665 [Planctomyces sp.]|nr:hypothetical protein [Planctomyces sp.]
MSFHLMPVYLNPELLDGMSPELKRRMQGKPCFTFAEIDKRLSKELSVLTKAGFASYKEQGFVLLTVEFFPSRKDSERRVT